MNTVQMTHGKPKMGGTPYGFGLEVDDAKKREREEEVAVGWKLSRNLGNLVVEHPNNFGLGGFQKRSRED